MSIATVITDGLGSYGNIATLVTDGLANYTALVQPVAAGYQYNTFLSLYGGSGDWLGAGSSPAVQIGDISIVPLVTSPNSFVITVNSDGTIDIASGSNNSRQEIIDNIYRVASNTIDGPGIIWDNEVPPFWGAGLNLLGLPVNVAISPVSLAGLPYAQSIEGDTLTFTSSGLPPGLTLSSAGLLTGTPTTTGSYAPTITAFDITGESTASPSNQISVLGVAVPNVVGLTVSAATALLNSFGFTNVGTVSIFTSTVTVGIIAAQSPAAGTIALPSAAISIDVSIGAYVPGPPPLPVMRVTTRQFNLLSMVEREWGAEFRAPDHRVYSFGGGKRFFDSTDSGNTGIYEPP